MALLKTNTGIGTTNPTSALHVFGDSRITGVVTAITFNGQVNAGVSTLGVSTASQLFVSGVTTSSSFVKIGGTSTQFLKADGSVDTVAYASQTLVGLATVGLTSETYVNTQVGLATVGLLASTGNGSSLTGIVTFITAGNNISVSQNTGNVTITGTGVSSGSNTTYTGNNTFSGITTFNGNVFSTSVLQVQQVEETYNPYTATINAAAVINLDCSTGNTFYITSAVNGNWTANLTNVAIGTSCLTNVTIMIIQGTTAYIPNALQIGGVSQTINWQGGSVPAGNNNKKDAIAFTIFYTGSVYNVFGQLVTFG